MSNHTPTPWQVNEDATGDIFISGADSKHVIDIGCDFDDDDNVMLDAQHIVACVNACGDLSPNQLQLITEKNILQQLNARADAEAQACDMLRKVLDNVKDYCVELRAALELHQELTRPIQRTMDILEKTKGYKV